MNEGQMHLEAVLVHKRVRRDRDLALPRQHIARGLIDRQRTKWRSPSISRRHGHAAYWPPMVRAQQDHALDDALALREQAIGGGRNVTRINMPRVRRDNGFGGKRRRRSARETSVHARGKLARVGGIESSSQGGGLQR